MYECFVVNRIGLAGGLAILWKEQVKISVLNYSKSHINVMVEEPKHFRLTLFYGSPVAALRKDSWNLLRWLKGISSDPWAVIGDFNETFFSWEAKGVGKKDMRKMRDFKEVAGDCGLLDIGFKGYEFTYSNRRRYPNEARARLDRILANQSWRSKFSQASVTQRWALASDHWVLVISLAGDRMNSERK